MWHAVGEEFAGEDELGLVRFAPACSSVFRHDLAGPHARKHPQRKPDMIVDALSHAWHPASSSQVEQAFRFFDRDGGGQIEKNGEHAHMRPARACFLGLADAQCGYTLDEPAD